MTFAEKPSIVYWKLGAVGAMCAESFPHHALIELNEIEFFTIHNTIATNTINESDKFQIANWAPNQTRLRTDNDSKITPFATPSRSLVNRASLEPRTGDFSIEVSILSLVREETASSHVPVRVNKLFYDVPDTVTSDAESRADGLTTLAKSVFPRFSHNFHVRVIPLIARFFFWII